MGLHKEGGMGGSGTGWNSISGVLVILSYLCHWLLKSKLFEIIHLQHTSIAKVKEIHQKKKNYYNNNTLDSYLGIGLSWGWWRVLSWGWRPTHSDKLWLM